MNREDQESHQRIIDIINQLSIAIRTAQIHSHNNIAVTSSLDKLTDLINNLFDYENTFSLNLRGDCFYFNESRVRYAFQYVLSINFLIREFRKIELGTVTIKSKVTSEETRLFVLSFTKSSYYEIPYLYLKESLSVTPKFILEEFKKIVSSKTLNVKAMVRKSYFNAVSHTKDVVQNIRTGEKVNLKRAKRVVTSMVNHLLQEEPFLLGMTAIKDYDDYTYHHSVNVSILSVALGQRMGLSRKSLIELGMVSLFHDIGKIDIPNTILNKPDSLTEEEWRLIKKHPIRGVMSILNIRRLDDLTARASIVAFEHHRNYDLSGYPEAEGSIDTDLFSRIVSIADRYDAMTSARVYSRTSMSPHKALSILKENAGTEIDPLVFRFFVNMVGLYPIGTLVMLDTKEIALVRENNQVFLTRPRITILTDNLGRHVDDYVIDLTEKNDDGQYKRTIQKTMDALRCNINVSKHLLFLEDVNSPKVA